MRWLVSAVGNGDRCAVRERVQCEMHSEIEMGHTCETAAASSVTTWMDPSERKSPYIVVTLGEWHGVQHGVTKWLMRSLGGEK